MKTNKSVSLKVVIALLAVVLLIGCAAGGTIAWLMTNTGTVTNTFTASNIEITLGETTGDTYKLIPGKTYAKDPVLTVESATDVDCWVFFKVEAENPGNFLSYELKLDGWTPLDGVDGVYYRTVATGDANKTFQLLEGKTGYTSGYVSISDSLTLDEMATAATAYLKFTAYAIQKEGSADAAAAWAKLAP